MPPLATSCAMKVRGEPVALTTKRLLIRIAELVDVKPELALVDMQISRAFPALVLVTLLRPVPAKHRDQRAVKSIPIIVGRHVNVTSSLSFQQQQAPVSNSSNDTQLPEIGDRSILMAKLDGLDRSTSSSSNDDYADGQEEQPDDRTLQASAESNLEKPLIEGKFRIVSELQVYR